jgi:hypothetical protein
VDEVIFWGKGKALITRMRNRRKMMMMKGCLSSSQREIYDETVRDWGKEMKKRRERKTYLAFCGPTLLTSKDEDAVICEDGIFPDSIPRGFIHSCAPHSSPPPKIMRK